MPRRHAPQAPCMKIKVLGPGHRPTTRRPCPMPCGRWHPHAHELVDPVACTCRTRTPSGVEACKAVVQGTHGAHRTPGGQDPPVVHCNSSSFQPGRTVGLPELRLPAELRADRPFCFRQQPQQQPQQVARPPHRQPTIGMGLRAECCQLKHALQPWSAVSDP